MASVVPVVRAIARNRALARVVLAYAVFAATQNAAWIGMLVYAFARGGAATAIAADIAPAPYAAAVVASVAVATTRPAQAVVVPALVRSVEELTAANAVTGWVESVGAVASSLATGILLAVAGPDWVFAAAGLAGLASVGLAGTGGRVPPPMGDDGAGGVA